MWNRVARSCRRLIVPRRLQLPPSVEATGVDDEAQLDTSVCLRQDKSTQISLLSPECPVCMLAYEWDTCKLQPVALRCGHSFCRGCLSSVVSKLCPTCRRAFRHDAMTMAPNYALRELMAPVSELLEDFEEYQPEEEMQQAVETVPLPAPPPLHTAHLQPPLHNAPQTPTVTVPAPNSAWDLLNEVPRVVVLVSPQTRAIPAQPAAPIPAPLVRAVQNMPPTTTSPTTVLLQRELMQLPQQVEQVLAQIPGGNLGNVHRSQVAATAASAPVEALVLQVAELPAAAVQRPPLMNPPAVVTPQPSAPTVHAFQPQIFPLAFQGAAYTLLQDLPAPNTALPAPNTVPLPQPTRVVVLVTCNILSILQSMVNAVTDPTNFDLGGQTFRCPAGAGLYISKDQVTLTNGTFVATQASQLRGACLNIFGNDVCLEGININFFTKGVAVCVGARLKMTACELCGEGTGITVSNTGGGVNTAAGNGSLTACNVVVQGSELGMVFQDCVAHLTDCEFKATVQGMRMSGASCKVCAKGMISAGCSLGLMVRGGASAEMLRCTWMDSLVSSVDVQDQGSVVDLIDCMLDIPAMPRGEGRVLVRDQ